jgi:hypothetical protein
MSTMSEALNAELAKLDKARLRPLNLKEIESRGARVSATLGAFLTERGLPEGEQPLLVTFRHREDAFEPVSHEGKNYFVIGSDEGTSLCVLRGAEEIWSLDIAESELPARFVSSSLPQFLALLNVFDGEQHRLEDEDDRKVHVAVKDLKRRLGGLDQRALSGGENWWSVVISQIEETLEYRLDREARLSAA